MSPHDTLTLEEISGILRISRNTLQRKDWRKRTGCPLKKIGKRLLAFRKDFEDWFRSIGS